MNLIVEQMRERLTLDGEPIRGAMSRASEMIGVTNSTIRNWIRGYDSYGNVCEPRKKYHRAILLMLKSKSGLKAHKPGPKIKAVV